MGEVDDAQVGAPGPEERGHERQLVVLHEHDLGGRASAAQRALREPRLVATMRRILLDPGQLGHVPLSLDYAACVDPRSLKALDRVETTALLAVAARVGNTRLIDNMVVGETRP